MPLQISHQPDAYRFLALMDGHDAQLVYRRSADVLELVHTGVPEVIAGRGVAAGLVKAALEHARAEGLRVMPSCSYAASYLEKHPEYAGLMQ